MNLKLQSLFVNKHLFCIRVITKLPNTEQSYKGKVKTHKYINTKSVNNRKTVKTHNDVCLEKTHQILIYRRTIDTTVSRTHDLPLSRRALEPLHHPGGLQK
jgi:hypothetical protein